MGRPFLGQKREESLERDLSLISYLERAKDLYRINYHQSNQFDEKSIFKETPNLIKRLIAKDLISAKNYLKTYLPTNIYDENIAQFGEYTLEAIIIYVLSQSFHSIRHTSMVRVSTFMVLLDRTVRIQALTTYNRKSDTSSTATSSVVDRRKIVDIKDKYQIGEKLLEFMELRKLISIETISKTEITVKSKGKAYREFNLFVVCNFELTLLPLKLNLPMVCKPLDWDHPINTPDRYYDMGIDPSYTKSEPYLLSDLRGGYLSQPIIGIYYRTGLLSSINLSNFNIELNKSNLSEMCSILNGLQKQGFQINKKVLAFIKKNREKFEEEGLLMPKILASVNLKYAFDLLRISYHLNDDIKSASTLDNLLHELSIRVQKARYDEFLINDVTAYSDYVFYLPAFMDFRGRIYRSGILHFHERDLARSLIVFANIPKQKEKCKQAAKDIVATAAAFKYKKFHLYDEALQWYKDNEMGFSASDESLITIAKDANDPFQFISKVLSIDTDVVLQQNCIPITQDASASAYQIMSYLLLNEEMARRTNLIPHPDGTIQDVYTYIVQDLKVFLQHRINDPFKMNIIESKLDRKLIKQLFMPMIYGKTMNSMTNDILNKYGKLISRKDAYELAKSSKELWSLKYPDIVNIMKLIQKMAWLCSTKDRAFYYNIPYFTTKQDCLYIVKALIRENICVYDRTTKKRRRATITIPTMKRDKRKTQTATCANFIHQKDAYIAMKVVESLLNINAPCTR